MSTLSWMVTILNRSRLPDFLRLYPEHGVSVNLAALGHGTASNDILNYFGLDGSEKAVCFSVISSDVWPGLKKDLRRRLHIDYPDGGVVFLVPMSSIGGPRELSFLTDGQEFARGEEEEMKGTSNELLVVISNQGYTELVMDAARAAGAAGGTVIHAKGTGMEKAERFLGVSLASEKDVIFIVSRTEKKNEIMQAIMQNAGLQTRAKSIVFSLPVTDTAGLRLLEDNENEEQ